MAQHPSLAYCKLFIIIIIHLSREILIINLTPLDLTGSMDGSVVMWEFGTPHHVSVQRSPGMGASVTKIRFTPEGNKVHLHCLSCYTAIVIDFKHRSLHIP